MDKGQLTPNMASIKHANVIPTWTQPLNVDPFLSLPVSSMHVLCMALVC